MAKFSQTKGSIKVDITIHNPMRRSGGTIETIFEIAVAENGVPAAREMVWLCLEGQGDKRFDQMVARDGKAFLTLELSPETKTAKAVVQSGSGVNINVPLDFTTLPAATSPAPPTAPSQPSTAQPIIQHFYFGSGSPASANAETKTDGGDRKAKGGEKVEAKTTEKTPTTTATSKTGPKAAGESAVQSTTGSTRAAINRQIPEEDDDEESVLTTIEISTPVTKVISGATRQLVARALDQRRKPMRDITFEWESADAGIGTVDNCGLFEAVAPGSVTIIVRDADNTVFGTIEMTVDVGRPSVLAAIMTNGVIVAVFAVFLAYFSNAHTKIPASSGPITWSLSYWIQVIARSPMFVNPMFWMAMILLGIFAWLNWKMNVMTYDKYRRNIIIASIIMAGIVGVYALTYHVEATSAPRTAAAVLTPEQQLQANLEKYTKLWGEPQKLDLDKEEWPEIKPAPKRGEKIHYLALNAFVVRDDAPQQEKWPPSVTSPQGRTLTDISGPLRCGKILNGTMVYVWRGKEK